MIAYLFAAIGMVCLFLLASYYEWMITLPTTMQLLAGGVLLLIPLFLIVKFIRHMRKRKKESKAYEEQLAKNMKEATYHKATADLRRLLAKDNGFNERQLLEYSEYLLQKIFETRENLDLGHLKMLVSSMLYEMFNYQIEDLKESGYYEKHKLERFLKLEITDYRQDLTDEYIDVVLQVYVEKGIYYKGTTKLVKGERCFMHQMTYQMTFMRQLGNVTSGQKLYAITCESCGGEVDLMQGDYCPFCHTYISMGSNTWMLDNFEESSRYA